MLQMWRSSLDDLDLAICIISRDFLPVPDETDIPIDCHYVHLEGPLFSFFECFHFFYKSPYISVMAIST